MRIRYYGHMGERTGYGVAAEHYCKALEAAGVEVERVPFTTAGVITVKGDPYSVYAEEIDAVIIHTLPLDCTRVLESLEFIEKTHGDAKGTPPCIAYTTWEALTVDWDVAQPIMAAFDEVWMPSEASAAPFRERTEGGERENVFVVPHCFPEGDLIATAAPPRAEGALFRFYWIGAWTARKNPSGLIRAFAHAFRPHYPGYEGDVELYLHSHGTPVEALAAELAATGLQRQYLPRIVLNNDYLDDATMKLLHARGDCFVSAARGEAWNLPCFEAMLHRNYIITTENLGSDDYLIDTTAQRINARRTPAWNTLVRSVAAHGAAGAEMVGGQGLTSHDLWLDVDLERFAAKMRTMYTLWANDGIRTFDVHYDMAARYGYAAVAKTILTRLENLNR